MKRTKNDSQFPKEYFKLLKDAPIMSGSKICGPTDNSITADEVYLLLESIYGEPNLNTKGMVFIDKKTTWEWVFETKNGYLACYDYKNNWSVGYRDKINEGLKEDAKKLVSAITNAVKMAKDNIKEESFSKFSNFLRAFGATRILLQRAHKEGFLIEGIVLYASLLDGLLRITLILKSQLDAKDDTIDELFIFQDENGPYYTERQIFKLAHCKKIINQKLYKEINSLYDQRNKIIHRFFLTDIEYGHLPNFLNRYELAYQEVYKVVYDLESEQIKQGAGMTVAGPKMTQNEKKQVLKELHKKIDSTKSWIVKPKRDHLFDE
jgi:hypothetical protein